MSVRSATQAPVLPLTKAQIELVRTHVPEKALAKLGDWAEKIPVISQLFDPRSPAIPAIIHGRLFFNDKFANSKKQEMTGIALSLFSEKEKDPLKSPCLRWHRDVIAFKEGECVGTYSYNRYYGDNEEDDWQSFQDDAHVKYPGFPENADYLMSLAIEAMLNTAKLCKPLPLFPTPTSESQIVPISPAPRAEDLLLDEAEPVRQPEAPELPQPAVERSWYEVIGDALSGCIASVVDCFKRFFGLTN